MAPGPLVCKTLAFEVVTPLYLGGIDASRREPDKHKADLERDAVLRVRPILAQWRYWFRAILGGIWGTSDLPAIAREEAQVFGGAGESRECASRLSCSLIDTRPLRPQRYPQLAYLAYGMHERRERRDGGHEVVELARWAIPPGQRFELRVVCTRDDWALLQHVIAVWSLLGGLGARHRRGAGSVRWLAESDRPSGALALPLATDHASLGRVVTEARKAFIDRFGSRRWAGTPDFDVVDPRWCVLKLSSVFPSWETALEAASNQLRLPVSRNTLPSTPAPPTRHLGHSAFGWRQRPDTGGWAVGSKGVYSYYQAKDHDGVYAAKESAFRHTAPPNPPPVVRNAVFGLPIAYPGWKTTIDLVVQSEARRRPSPLAVRVLKVGNAAYAVLLLLFKRNLLPPNAEVKANVKVRTNRPPVPVPVSAPPDLSEVEAFVNKCDGNFIAFT